MIDRALAGIVSDILAYIQDFDLEGIPVPVWTAVVWEKLLPTWKSREGKRGLKEWSSAGAGGWVVPGVCARVINMALDKYMYIFGVPPVVEGEVSENGTLRPKKDGIDLIKTFLLTVHLYPQNISSKHLLKTPPQNIPS